MYSDDKIMPPVNDANTVPVQRRVGVGDASFPNQEIRFGRATIRALFGVAVRNPGKSPGISIFSSDSGMPPEHISDTHTIV
jgi:hypothetical protein